MSLSLCPSPHSTFAMLCGDKCSRLLSCASRATLYLAGRASATAPPSSRFLIIYRRHRTCAHPSHSQGPTSRPAKERHHLPSVSARGRSAANPSPTKVSSLNSSRARRPPTLPLISPNARHHPTHRAHRNPPRVVFPRRPTTTTTATTTTARTTAAPSTSLHLRLPCTA